MVKKFNNLRKAFVSFFFDPLLVYGYGVVTGIIVMTYL